MLECEIMKSDKITGIFWLIFGLLISQQSYRLNLGGFHRPGSGLFPFLIGLFIAVASSVLLIQSWLSKSVEKEEKEMKNVPLLRLFLCLISLYAYAVMFEWLGYVPSTFLLILCLLKIAERRGWVTVVITAFLISVTSYLFFETILHAALPRGIFGI